MKTTDQNFMTQMRIHELEIQIRKDMVDFMKHDAELLKECGNFIRVEIDDIVAQFYTRLVENDDMDRIIGNADTLERLHRSMRQYICELFDGFYGMDYVNSRLRIGMVHQRIGLELKYYSASVLLLQNLLEKVIRHHVKDTDRATDTVRALEKLFVFDAGFVYDTYQQSLVNQITIAKEKADRYARILEEKVVRRTQEINNIMRRDVLTDVHNRRSFEEQIRKDLANAQRQNFPLSLVYLDVDHFKNINDSEGHQRGDEVLTSVGRILNTICREGDTPARIGGDEFCVILPHTTAEKSLPFCERIIAEFKQTHDGAYSLSIGIAQTGPDTVLAAEDFVPKADAAMYESKNNPGSQVTIHQPTDACLHAVQEDHQPGVITRSL